MRGRTARPTVGEVVFTTGMSGYQESMSDPSFAGQLITFTYPHIGNYGVSGEAMESERAWARGRDHARGVRQRRCAERRAGLAAVAGGLRRARDNAASTRARWCATSARQGSMRGGIFPASIDPDEARALIEAEPPMDGQDLAAVVSPTEVSHHGEGAWPADRGARHGYQGLDRAQPRRARSTCLAVPLHDAGGGAAGAATPTRSCWPTAPATRRRWGT